MTAEFESFAIRGLEPTAPLRGTTTIKATSSDVWAAIRERGNLLNIHPFCAANEVDRWPGPAGRDTIRYYSGIQYQRDVMEWRDGVGYDLAVGPSAGAIAFARWTITPVDAARCDFSIEVTSFVREDVTGPARTAYVDRVINGAIPPYLDAVVRGVGYFVETGDPVVRNQFGAHAIYSPPTG